jgi:hypothetical protein
VNKVDIYRQILRDIIQDDMQIEDIVLRAFILHTHSLLLRTNISVDDVEGTGIEQRILLAPLTRTHVTELLSSLWPRDQQRGREDFWLTHYSRLTPYDLFVEITDNLRDKAIAARENVASHDLVQELIEE